MSSISQGFPQVSDPNSPGARNDFTLFDAGAVGLATFFGTPVAGATLMLVNDRRLGRGGRGILTLLLAMVVTGLVVLVGWNIPQGVSSVFALILVVLMAQTARWLQGAAVQQHVQAGGRVGSRWTAFGVGICYLVLIFGTVFLAVFLPAYKLDHGPKVLVGKNDEVFYSGAATQAEAQALGSALKGDGYFMDKGVTVVLEKGKDGTVISFVVKEGIWDQTAMLSSFEEIGREVAGSVGGLPMKVRLMDKERTVETESNVGRVDFPGNDDVYYFGSATAQEAKALGDELKSSGFFSGKGSDVFYSKHADGKTLAFIVADGVWGDAAMVANFEKTARDAAPSIGGLPLKLQLDSTTLDVKKDETLR